MEQGVQIGVRPPPRDRILGAASTLFYARGINSVSVEDIATAAGSNKMTFYRHFGSKDLLVVEWLRSTAEGARRLWRQVEETHPGDALARLHALTDMMVDQISEWMRGCPFANSLAELSDPEHPAHDVIRDYFQYQRAWLEGACEAAGLCEPQSIADALFFIIRGTSTGLALDDATEFARRERRALTAVIDAAARR